MTIRHLQRPIQRYKVSRLAIRRAYTLFEVLISLGISGLLIAGIASTMLVASKSADSAAPTTLAIESARVVHQIASELARAKLILGHSNTEIRFLIEDLNSDGTDDLVHYALAGDGSQLTRSLNGAPPESILSSVAYFQLDLITKSVDVDTQLRTRSTPAINAAHESISSSSTVVLDVNHSIAQFVTPGDFATTLPDDADTWAVHAVSFRASQSGVVDGSLQVEIRAADSFGHPTSLVLASETVDESALPPALDWVDVTFENPVITLNPANGICIVLKHASGTDVAIVEYDIASTGGASISDTAGATWSLGTLDRLAFRLTNSHESRGPLTLSQKFASQFQIALAQQNSIRITREGAFHAQPDLVANFYEAQFNEDPTSLDLNRDSTVDWTLDSGTIAGLADGIWSAGAAKRLQLTTPENVTSLTRLDLSCRSTQAVGDGAVMHVDADWQEGTFVPLTLKLCLQTDGTQRLVLATEESAASKSLCVLNKLPAAMLAITLQIDPVLDHVRMTVNGFDCGAFSYQPQTQPAGTPEFFLTNDIGTAEFDHVSVRVMETLP